MWLVELERTDIQSGLKLFQLKTEVSVTSTTAATTTSTSPITSLDSVKVDGFNLEPFVLYDESYTEDKLPKRYMEDTVQNYTVASNYSLNYSWQQCTDTLVVVKSARSNSDRRKLMRKELTKLKGISYYFIMGLSPTNDTEEENQLLDESMSYGDLVFGDFIDTYYNLTVKSLSALEWALSSCQDTKAVVLIDDDIHVTKPEAFNSLSGDW